MVDNGVSTGVGDSSFVGVLLLSLLSSEVDDGVSTSSLLLVSDVESSLWSLDTKYCSVGE